MVVTIHLVYSFKPKNKNMNKLLVFRSLMIVFIVLNTIVFGKLETGSDCLFMFLTFLIALAYLAAEVINVFDDWAKEKI